jgi:hypothetical protein
MAHTRRVGFLAAASVAGTLLAASADLLLIRRMYGSGNLVTHTLEQLNTDRSVQASMETLRHAVIDAHGSRPWAIIAQYWPQLNDRSNACADLSFRPANTGALRASCPCLN